jgi:hypothetical protein
MASWVSEIVPSHVAGVWVGAPVAHRSEKKWVIQRSNKLTAHLTFGKQMRSYALS